MTQEDQADAELARTLRPVLMFDGRETRFPLDIGAAVANNSHASYPSPCPRTCKQFRRLFGTPVGEGAHDGRLPWTRTTTAPPA